MGRTAVALAVICIAGLVGLGALAGCHLADKAEVECEPGSHPESGRCVADLDAGASITINPDEGGAGCTVSPDSIKVTPNVLFEFKNADSVDHVISGVDGQTWASVKAGGLSPLVAITRAGSWPYTVSGCTKGGTVVVE